MKLLLWIFQFAFGCRHSQRSGVFTIKKRTYQVCLECGQEFEYSWTLMRSLRSHRDDNVHVPLNRARPADASVI
jgi:hypothetical protein